MRIGTTTRTLLAAAFVLAGTGCAGEEAEYGQMGASSDSRVVLEAGFAELAEPELTRRGRVYLPRPALERVGLQPGQQVRVWFSDGWNDDCHDPFDEFMGGCALSLLFTLQDLPADSPNGPTLGANGLQRVLALNPDFESGHDFIIDRSVAGPDTDFREEVYDNVDQRELIALAPHGGSIEAHTDAQAMALCDASEGRFGAWYGRGMGPDQLGRLHVTSTDISPNPWVPRSEHPSFTRLGALGQGEFRHAVSFHGFKTNEVCEATDYCIDLGGGHGSASLRDALAERLRSELRPEGSDALHCGSTQVPLGDDIFVVRTDANHDDMDGGSSNNIVNWMTTSGDRGIQVEQTLPVREQCGIAVAQIVARFYAEQLDASA